MDERHVFTVTELNNCVKELVESVPAFGDLLLKGEISNYKVYPSGHHYFTLKDSQSALRCVMFKGSAAKLRFRPENGMQAVSVSTRGTARTSCIAADCPPMVWATCT